MTRPAVAEDARLEHEAWVRSIAPNDLGDGDHRWGWWPWDLAGKDHHDLAWSHRCTNHGEATVLVVARVDVTSGRYHHLVAVEPLHVEASILCPACRDHGFIRAGTWRPA